MNKKIMKVVTIIIITLLIACSFTQIALATSPDQITAQEPGDTSGILGIAGQILGFLQVLAVALLVIMVAVLGIKYMAGSAEEKAEYKKSFVPLIIGAILVFAAVTIANFIFNIVQGA